MASFTQLRDAETSVSMEERGGGRADRRSTMRGAKQAQGLTMKKLLLTTAVLAASIGSAFAADLPSVKAPPVIALPPPVWTGFYVGVNGGFGGGYGDATLAILGPIAFGFASANTTNMNFGYGDFFIGGQAGYNYQFANRVVVGLETDMQWSGISARASANNVAATLGPGGFGTAAVFSGSAHFGQDWFGTTRLRVGYAL